MDMIFNLNLNQEQKLIMTQKMQQSLKILQMSFIELNEFVEEKLEENPALEIAQSENKDKNVADTPLYESISNIKKIENYKDFDNYDHSYHENNKEEVSPFTFIAEKKSLKDYLYEQIGELECESEIKNICSYLIENIDNRGYLGVTLNEVSNDLKISLISAEKALNLIQDLEPIGIGARDLSECMKIQLRKKKISDDYLEAIIDNYLEFVACNNQKAISKCLNISINDVQKYVNVIKSLEPKPARGFFSGDDIGYVIPDVFIEKVNDELFVNYNEKYISQLIINPGFEKISSDVKDNKLDSFVKEKLSDAVFVIKSIENRKNTIILVFRTILQIQNRYFIEGGKYLVPMTLRTVANILNMSESTISRSISGKYIQCDFGIIKVKDLFTGSINSDSDDKVSSKVVKNAIAELISKEDSKKPFSDQEICDILKEKSMNISSRTVAKYREELNIRSSSKRKLY
jgi:RNA polymerase sigma-54 factor